VAFQWHPQPEPDPGGLMLETVEPVTFLKKFNTVTFNASCESIFAERAVAELSQGLLVPYEGEG
jgi:hypothetical protein